MRWPFFIVAVLTGALLAQPASRPFADFKQEVSGVTEKFEMVAIKGGKFTMMGTPDGKPREVEVKDFHIARIEMTWDVYDTWAFAYDQTDAEKRADDDLPKEKRSRPSQPYHATDFGFGHAGYPVVGVTHKSAGDFCQWLSQKTGRKYRLPTEAEWEYAARAGGAAEVDAKLLEKIAVYRDNSDDKTQPAGSKAANAWGLHDVLGNAGEWCIGLDGKPVVRGGSWRDRATSKRFPPLNFAHRLNDDPNWNLTDPSDPDSVWWLRDGQHVGFRVVCEGP